MKKLLLLLLLALPLNAQWNNSVFIGMANLSGLGYTSPTYTLGAEVKYKLNQFTFSFDGDWSPNRKTNEEFGWSGTSHLNAFYSVPETPIIGGGCVGYSYTKAPLWSKSSFRPCVVLGIDQPISQQVSVLATARQIFSGTDKINELNGQEYELRLTYQPFGAYIKLNGNVYHFLDSNNHDKSYDRTTYGFVLGKIF